MALSIAKPHPRFCAEISGVDLAGPIDEATFGAISDAFDTHAVLVFRGQKLDDAGLSRLEHRMVPDNLARIPLGDSTERNSRAEFSTPPRNNRRH